MIVIKSIFWLVVAGFMIFSLGFLNLVFDVREDNRLDRQIRREEREKENKKQQKTRQK